MDTAQLGLYAQLIGGVLLFLLFFGSIVFSIWIYSIHKQYGNPKLVLAKFREHNRKLTTETHEVADDGTFESLGDSGNTMTYQIDRNKVWWDTYPGGVPQIFQVSVATFDFFRGKPTPLDPIIHDDKGAASMAFIASQKLYMAALQLFARAFANTMQKAEIVMIVLAVVGILASAGAGYMAMQASNSAKLAASQTTELMDLIQNGPQAAPSGTPTAPKAPVRPTSLTGAP